MNACSFLCRSQCPPLPHIPPSPVPTCRPGAAWPAGWSGLPSLPPSFFILVILKGPLWGLMYHLWGCQRHLGMGWGSLMFPCRETPNNKGNGPTFDSGVCFCLNLLPRRAQQALSCRDCSGPHTRPCPALHPLPHRPGGSHLCWSPGHLGGEDGAPPLQGQDHTAEVPHGPAGPTCPPPLSPDPFFPRTLCP